MEPFSVNGNIMNPDGSVYAAVTVEVKMDAAKVTDSLILVFNKGQKHERVWMFSLWLLHDALTEGSGGYAEWNLYLIADNTAKKLYIRLGFGQGTFVELPYSIVKERFEEATKELQPWTLPSIFTGEWECNPL